MLFITRQTRPNKRRGKNPGARPTHGRVKIPRPIQGRTNIQYVQHMDEKMRTSLNLSKRLVQPMDEEVQNKFINTKTIQHMDEVKVLMVKVNKFKDE